MNEKEFIYGRLNYLNEQVNFLTNMVEEQSDLIGTILNVIKQMQSPEYASKQVELAKMKDVADKLNMIRGFSKK